jgi:hypothetical protein
MMAFNLSDLPRHLGRVSFDGKDYEILTITTYIDGKQRIELRNLESGEVTEMAYTPSGYRAL